jgi:hypothetical protein
VAGADRTQLGLQDGRMQRGPVHYVSEGQRIRVFIQLQSPNDDSEINLGDYLEAVGAFVIKYEGKQQTCCVNYALHSSAATVVD